MKNKKRKIGIPVLAAALMLSFAGCADKPSDESAVSAESSQTVQPAEAATAPDNSPAAETTPAETTSATESAPAETSSPEEPAAQQKLEKPEAPFFLSMLDYDESDNTWSAADETYGKFVELMKKECARSPEIKGTFLLANDDKVLFFGGINGAEKDGKTKVGAYTTYEIGSVTKTFTATAVLQLCEQGKLSLEDTIDKYIPGFEYGSRITVYQLLHMQAGLRREYFTEEKLTDPEVFKKFYSDGYTDEELIATLNEGGLEYEPGSKMLYSNVSYSLLARVIEKVSGESYDEYVQKNIFDVCGMEHTSSMKSGDLTTVPEKPPEGYYQFDIYEVFPEGYWTIQRSYRGAGDIHSCAADMLMFDRSLMGGKLLGEEYLAEMFKADKRYGCGWQQYSGDKNVFSHEGATALYLALNTIIKSEKYGNIYLIQLHSNIADYECISDSYSTLVNASKY